MAHTIVHFEIAANDPEQFAEFYRGLFGCQIERTPGGIVLAGPDRRRRAWRQRRPA